MAAQIQLANTFNEFRAAYNDAANDVTILQTANNDIQSRVNFLENSNTAIFGGTAQLYANTLQLIDIEAGGRVLISRTPLSGSGGIIDSDADLRYVTANNTLIGANVLVDNQLVLSTLTSGRVLIAGASGLITDDSGLTYVAGTDSLNASGNITATAWSNAANMNITNNVLVGANVNVTNTVNAASHLHVGGADAWIFAKDEDQDIHLVTAVAESDGAHDIAIVNRSNSANAYAELIAINNAGNTDNGWVSLGINATNYNQGAFAITKGDDAYLLYQAPVGTTKEGDLIIGTGGNGTKNRVIIAAAGFDDPANNTQIVIDPGNNVHIEIGTESISTSTGALTVNGGIGLVGNLNVGGNVAITGSITLTGAGNTVSTDTLAVANAILFLANGNSTDSLDIGIVGQFNNTYFGVVRDRTSNTVRFFQDLATRPANTTNFAAANYSNVRVGVLHSSNTTAATNPSSGGLIVTGGAGIGGTIWAGGTIRTDSTTASTSTSSGALIINGGAGVAGNTNIGGITKITDSTASTSTSTGALQVSGGAGIAGAINVGGNTTFASGNTALTNGTSNWLYFNNVGVNPPTATTRSAGTKIVIYPTSLVSQTDYAIGIASSTMWYSVPTTSDTHRWYAGTTEIGAFSGNGVFTSTGGFVESSSITLKENITPIEDALDVVMKMLGVTYDRKDGSNFNEAGMVAEHLNSVAPNLVQKDKDGNPNAIFYSRVTAYLVEAIKTLKNQIDPLKEEIRKLKGE